MLKACLGRDEVQGRLASAISRSRWVTVVGPPGCGKTLLVGHAVADAEHSAWVEARGLRSLEDVLTACLDALRTETAPGDAADQALVRGLDGSATVLVLDGADLDTPGVGPYLQRLLEATSGARLVVTSVSTAGQPDERVVRVPPLPLPRPAGPPTGPVVDLFLARLEAAGGRPVDLAVHDREVRRLLHATGGLPLLVEQAAVQAALVGLGQRDAEQHARRGGARVVRPARRGPAPVLPPAGDDAVPRGRRPARRAARGDPRAGG